ncbi:hypothetical protein B9479_006626 [Cryptococcus floricola]|uniref:Uncharacterized protein n=1 Tax=Cryptococcus floricola TaxID=2591691 RepID=A0A5D3AMQ7_9TREE|nr:hypothetical protein B9479_006626 [Cryptococcus floricola]
MRIPYRRHYHHLHPHPKRQVREEEVTSSAAVVVSSAVQDSTSGNTAETTGREVAASSDAVSSGAARGETSLGTSKVDSTTATAASSSALRSEVVSTHASSSSATSSSSESAARSSAKVETVTAKTSSTRSTPLNPIRMTTFASDFPVSAPSDTSAHKLGRGYVFLPNNTAGDSMLLFVTFFVAFLVFTACFIRCTSFLDRRRARKRGGRVKEDTVVGDEMKWAEGREVVERKVVWQNAGHGERAGREMVRGVTH